MRFIRLKCNSALTCPALPALAITIGNFDGVHLGHQFIFQQLGEYAEAKKLKTAVLFFEPQPNERFNPSKATRLMSLREKLQAFRNHYIDYAICYYFDACFAAMSAEHFVQAILSKQLNAGHVLVGDDFRFGHQRRGDFQLLSKLAKQGNFSAQAMPSFPPPETNSPRISSTLIRQLVQTSNFQQARQLLGKNFSISGHITYGDQRGRSMGFATANVSLKNLPRPLSGVFIVTAYVNGRAHAGIANLGWRPTLKDKRYLLEVHLLDFNKTIYGERMTTIFIEKIRDEKKFPSLAALQAQIAKDVAIAADYFLRLKQ